jgi:hypothetical protein
MSDSAKETAERDSRWIGEFADDLNVAIALREWDRAVELVEQGALLLLANGLSQQVIDVGPDMTVKANHAHKPARCLCPRSKKCCACGKLRLACVDMTTIFTVIKHAADWFLATFKENQVASSEWSRFGLNMSFLAYCLIGFVKWAKS